MANSKLQPLCIYEGDTTKEKYAKQNQQMKSKL